MIKSIHSGFRYCLYLASLFLLTTAFLGCGKPQEPVKKSTFMLNTTISITLYDSDDTTIIDGAFDLCQEYENQFSRALPNSQVGLMNNREPDQTSFPLTAEMEELLTTAMKFSELSAGAFDITISPLSTLWNFSGGNTNVPAPAAISAVLPYVDYHNIVLENGQITFLSSDTQIDLGGIAKGYIADKIKEYLIKQGVNSAIINLGGNVLCLGNKPDGSSFQIGVQKPFEDRNETVAILSIADLSVVSSGVYERHFVVDGVNYHHLLNPQTGYPFDNGLLSVTIISSSSADGDALSTACFGLGLEKGLALIDSLPDTWAVFIMDDGTIHYSSGADLLIAQ